jgi:hypothetical protein
VAVIKVRVKEFDKLPPGIHPHQRRYVGKVIAVRKVPIIIGYCYEQIDPLQESIKGKWLWSLDDVTPVKGRKNER